MPKVQDHPKQELLFLSRIFQNHCTVSHQSFRRKLLKTCIFNDFSGLAIALDRLRRDEKGKKKQPKSQLQYLKTRLRRLDVLRSYKFN